MNFWNPGLREWFCMGQLADIYRIKISRSGRASLSYREKRIQGCAKLGISNQQSCWYQKLTANEQSGCWTTPLFHTFTRPHPASTRTSFYLDIWLPPHTFFTHFHKLYLHSHTRLPLGLATTWTWLQSIISGPYQTLMNIYFIQTLILLNSSLSLSLLHYIPFQPILAQLPHLALYKSVQFSISQSHQFIRIGKDFSSYPPRQIISRFEGRINKFVEPEPLEVYTYENKLDDYTGLDRKSVV